MMRDQNELFNQLYERTQEVGKSIITEGVDDAEREEDQVDVPVDDGRDIPDPPDGVNDDVSDEPLDVTKEFIGQNDDKYFYLITSEDGGDRDIMIVDQDGNKAMSAKEMELDVSNETIPEFLMKVFQDGLIAQIESSIFTKYILPEIMKDDEEELIDDEEISGEEDVADTDEGASGDEEVVEESIKEESAVLDRPKKEIDATNDEVEDYHDQMVDDNEKDEADVEDDSDADDDLEIPRAPTEQDIEDAYNYFLRSANASSDPIRKNAKTGLSIDFDMECPYRKAGKPCSYCYVENTRTNAKSWIQRLMVNGGLTLQQIKDNADVKKYVHVPGPGWYKVVRRKDPVIQGKSIFSMGAAAPSMISGRVEYTPGTLQRKRKLFNPKTIAELNASGGVRLYSFSDYNVEDDDSLGKLFDDADAIGLKIKAITKMPDFIKKWSSRTGVSHISVDNLAAYGMESNAMPLEQAAKLASEYENVKIRAVAFNPEEAIEYASNSYVDIITPFHGKVSKLPAELQVITKDMGHATKGNNELMAKIRTELDDTGKAKFCCYTGKCKTCKVGCGKGETNQCDVNWDEIIDDIIDKNTASMAARGKRRAVESEDFSRCPFRIDINERELNCNPEEECIGDCGDDCTCFGEGKCVGDEEADDMTPHEVYESAGASMMIIEMIITDKEGNKVEVKLEDPQAHPEGEDVGVSLDGDMSDEKGEVVSGYPSTSVSVNGRMFTFSNEFLENWRNMDSEITEEGLEELALDALSGLDPEEYHALLAHGPEGEAEETGGFSEETSAPAPDPHDEDELEEGCGGKHKKRKKLSEAEEEDFHARLIRMMGTHGEYGVAIDAIIHFMYDSQSEGNVFNDGLYKTRTVNSHEADSAFYEYASRFLMTMEYEMPNMSEEELIDEVLKPLEGELVSVNNRVNNPTDESVKEVHDAGSEVGLMDRVRSAVDLATNVDETHRGLFADAVSYFLMEGKDIENSFYRDNLYRYGTVNRHEDGKALYLCASQYVTESEITNLTDQQIADDIIPQFSEKCFEIGTSTVEERMVEKKSVPNCSKCDKAHWPFQPCGGADKKEDKAEDAEEKDTKDDKDVEESVSITESKSMDRLHMLLGS